MAGSDFPALPDGYSGPPPARGWWRRSAFIRSRAAHRHRLRPAAWLLHPINTFWYWFRTPRPTETSRQNFNNRVVRLAQRDPLLTELDRNQRRAAVCFDDRVIVTAGAGGGKTRMITARAMYANQRLGCKARHIALVTFTNRAAAEIRDRTASAETAEIPFEIGTIHQLARRVLRVVDGRTIQLSPLAEDEERRREAFTEWLRRATLEDHSLIADKLLRKIALSHRMKDGKAVYDFRAPPDDVKVKSHGEVEIATLLHLSGTRYTYEASFPFPPNDPHDGIRGYRPDFYLPDNPLKSRPKTHDDGIWLEHYAHDRRGMAPAEFKRYDEHRRWKIKLHGRLKTRYIETSYGDLQRARDGDGPKTERILTNALRKHGRKVEDPESWKEKKPPVGSQAKEAEKDEARLAVEIAAWIGAKRRQAPGAPAPERSHDPADAALARLGRAVLKRYDEYLAKTGTEDHDTTILKALDAARRHPERLPWRHILVDEYQDVNPAQAAFLHSLLTPRSDGSAPPTLTAVGDNWQAIFGFQGGDPTLITSGADPSNCINSHAERIIIENCYRFGPPLSDAARALVTEGGAEDRPAVGKGPRPPRGYRPITAASCRPTDEGIEEIPKAITKTTRAVLLALKHWIPSKETDDDPLRGTGPVKVLVMGRRNADILNPAERGNEPVPYGLDQPALRRAVHGTGVNLDFSTIHSAKGTEADYAILIDSGPSFAAATAEEQALKRAIAAEVGPRTEDEHRLWYVALTRAKRAALILVVEPRGGTSRTTDLLLQSTDPRIAIDVELLSPWLHAIAQDVPCPGCNAVGDPEGARLRPVRTRKRHFAGCSKWNPADDETCSYTQPGCETCSGMLQRAPDQQNFKCGDCSELVPACRCTPPRPMVVRRQRRTNLRFWGCWLYGRAESCRWTISIDRSEPPPPASPPATRTTRANRELPPPIRQ